jgi:hypothetical protein
MAESMDSLTSKYDGISTKIDGVEGVLRQILDKLSGIESSQSKSDASLISLARKYDDAAARLQPLEALPPPQLPLRPPQTWINPFYCNPAPGDGTRPSASSSERPSGHHQQSGNRDAGRGILGSFPPHPVTGMSQQPPSHFPDSPRNLHNSLGKSGSTPKMSFPSFDGENPRLWEDRCELYFEIYNVHDALKPRFDALNFKGAAAAWLQTFELRGRVDTWERLYTAVCDRFDRNQYQLVMRQLDNLRQTSSVQEYHVRFEQLAHQLLLYNAQYDDVYFVTRFMGGLKEEIRAPIALHQPKNVDTASALALLQEEEVEASKDKYAHKHESKSFSS